MEYLAYVIGGLVFSGIASYIFLMMFFPEWVGISGKASLRDLEEHREGSQPSKDPDILS